MEAKTKRIVKSVAIDYALRTVKALDLYTDTPSNNNILVYGIVKKYYNWIAIKTKETSQNISCQSSINRAIQYQEFGIIKYNDVEELLEKADNLLQFMIKE